METNTSLETPKRFFFQHVPDNSFFYCKKGSNLEDGHIELPILLSIVILLCLIGNILILVIYVSSMRLRLLAIIFMFNLALPDLLFTAGLVFRVYENVWDLTCRDVKCEVSNYTFPAGCYYSIVFLVLMSVQRSMALVHPDSGWNKGKCIRYACFCGVIVSILAVLPVAVHTAALPYPGVCINSLETALVAIMYEYNIVFLCAFLVMDFCFIRIFQILLNSLTNQKHRSVGLAFFRLATFFTFGAPHYLMNFLYILAYHLIEISAHNCFYSVKYICCILALTRCFLVPVSYALFGVKFREEMGETVQTTDGGQNATEESPKDESVIV